MEGFGAAGIAIQKFGGARNTIRKLHNDFPSPSCFPLARVQPLPVFGDHTEVMDWKGVSRGLPPPSREHPWGKCSQNLALPVATRGSGVTDPEAALGHARGPVECTDR